MVKFRALALGRLLLLPFLLLGTHEATAQDAFYDGKTLRLIVPTAPGASFDIWSRLLARHMKRQISGNPNIIVQNMPGGGQVIAANYLYRVAKPDGLTFGMLTGTLYLFQIARASGVEYNWSDFTFIGRAAGAGAVFFIRADLPFKDWREVRSAKQAIPVGSAGSGTRHMVPVMMRDVLGFNLNIVAGYPGAALIDAALERGEVSGSAFAMPAYIAREPALSWHKRGFVRTILQIAKTRDHRLNLEVPTIWEIAKELRAPAEGLEFMETVTRSFDLLFTYVAPPRLPVERTRVLREAFHSTMKDPLFVREVEKALGEGPDPMEPEELQRLAAQVMKVGPQTAARVRELLRP